MLGTVIGTIAGRRNGGSGVKGALIGTIAQRGLRVLGPVGTVAALGYAAYKGYQRWADKPADETIDGIAEDQQRSYAALGSAAVRKAPAA